jgi:hypothetical protein
VKPGHAAGFLAVWRAFDPYVDPYGVH